MGVYKISQKAEIDLAKIYEYGIEIFGVKQAKSYLIGIHEVFEILTATVNLARDASEFMLLLKRFSYKSHTIFYLVTAIDLLIFRVLNQSMDYENNL
jgi:toxin ParE1/3/4